MCADNIIETRESEDYELSQNSGSFMGQEGSGDWEKAHGGLCGIANILFLDRGSSNIDAHVLILLRRKLLYAI